MKRIVVASTNPVKLNSALQGFQRIFPGETFEIRGVSVPSGVRDQPMGREETLRGAMNRLAGIASIAEADYWVGIEGGIEEFDGTMEATAWVAVQDRRGRIGQGKTGSFILPQAIVALIRQGKELGEADDIVFGLDDNKRKTGVVGVLTGNALDRTAYYVHAVILALIPFRNEGFYPTIAETSPSPFLSPRGRGTG